MLICLLASIILLALGYYTTLSTVVRAIERREDSEDEEGFKVFLDKDGNHQYYERSLIEKKRFLREHKEVREEELRSFRRFFNLTRISYIHKRL